MTNEEKNKNKQDNEFIVSIFTHAIKKNGLDPKVVKILKTKDESVLLSIKDILKGITSIKEAITFFRQSKASNPRAPSAIESAMKKRILAQVIILDMTFKGRFLKDDDGVGYYFQDEKKEVRRIGTLEKVSYEIMPLLSQQYGINITLPEDRYIVEEIKNHTINNGYIVKIYHNFHFDKDTKTLYIHDRENMYYILNGNTLETSDNGKDGIYFVKDSTNCGGTSTPLKYISCDQRPENVIIQGEKTKPNLNGSLISRLIVNRLSFSSNNLLSDEEQRILLTLYLYSIPFIEYYNTRPVFIMTGVTGSGKSMYLKLVGRFIDGPQFNLENLPREDDLKVLLAGRDFVYLDNIDNPPMWLMDIIAIAATGGKTSKRKLYENYEIATGDISCFLGFTTRYIEKFREDVIDRAIVISIQHPTNFLSESALLDPISQYQDLMISEYMDNLNQIINVMRNSEHREIYAKSRFADWEIHCKQMGPVLGIDPKLLDSIFPKMCEQKAHVITRYDPLIPVLEEWRNSDNNTEQWVSAGELHGIFPKDDAYSTMYSSVIALGKRLRQISPELQILYEMKEKENKTKKVWYYQFKNDNLKDGFFTYPDGRVVSLVEKNEPDVDGLKKGGE